MIAQISRSPIANFLKTLNPKRVVIINKKRKELKEKLLDRFDKEQIKSLMEELDVKSPEELKRMLTFEDLVLYAQKYGVPYSDLVEELERFKQSLTN